MAFVAIGHSRFVSIIFFYIKKSVKKKNLRFEIQVIEPIDNLNNIKTIMI